MESEEAGSCVRLYANLAKENNLKSASFPKAPKPSNKPKTQVMKDPDPEDPCCQNYGDLPRVQSQTHDSRSILKLSELNEEIKEPVWVRARLHSSRIKGNLGFLILRQGYWTVQCTLLKGQQVSKQMIKYASSISNESVIDVYGTVTIPSEPIKSCTISSMELQIQKLHCVSRAFTPLPFQLEDANQPMTLEQAENEGKGIETEEEGGRSRVKQKVRLDNRYIDLRLPVNQALMRLSSGICQFFREFLYQNGFTEIHTPKLIAGTSEGGAEVFRTTYFERNACLAQSPQLYKQMAIMADLDRVFEIGPVFRAENSNTHRHLCEFVGLDFEMAIKEHYFEVLEVIHNLFVHIFKGLEKNYASELKAVYNHFPFIEPFQYTEKPLFFTFQEAAQILNEAGYPQDPMEDLKTEAEKLFGKIVKEKYHTDFYVIHRYPAEVRPFYTMICEDDPNWTCSFDVFMRGEEIISGAQRIHDPDLLRQRAIHKGIDVSTIKDYIDSFRFGAFPHGGAGVGLERVLMLFCGLKNIRWSSMFPRDPKRLTP